MYHKIYNGLSAPYEAILLKGHLDENEVREALGGRIGRQGPRGAADAP